MWNEQFYTVVYHDTATGENKKVLISASHHIVRIKEILAEAHPNWQIQDIIPKEAKET